jgi:hypothetical protein
MKNKLIYTIIISILISASCSGNSRKYEITNINPEKTLQAVAVFKSAEKIYEDEWKLIFRKIDDCQYIIFYIDIKKSTMVRDNLIILSENTLTTNPDFVNLRFSINYIEETALDHLTGENAVINRLKDINRSQSERFIITGIDNDILVDDFILNLKKYIKNDSIMEISGMLSYPLNAVLKKKKIKINNPETFIQQYNNIFTKRVKDAILKQSPADVKAGTKGIMIGTGEILINHTNNKILITTINTY